jgi:2-dehydro-3-deoxyphosphogalactonate aldolase
MNKLQLDLKKNPVVAILRGLQKHDASQIADVLVEFGVRILEIPLNREGALEALLQIKKTHGELALIGAGTVTSFEALGMVADADVDFCLAPNLNEAIVFKAQELGLSFVPGAFTPSEVFRASELGCEIVKIFPFDQFGYSAARALLQVLPEHTKLLAVGGLKIDDLGEALENGLAGVGVGSSLFRAGMTSTELRTYLESKAGAR